ncbi:hypothetical protein AAE021_14565 [Arthrobacter citreus]|uniref:Restriction endonuclease n=1 Tax=Arthrobacter citreus TaxID=1670 RepID=A0ABZ2ZT71_9MICC
MTVYNQQPRPRVLFEALPEELAREMAELVPTSRIVAAGEEVADSEFDLVVTQSKSAANRRTHMHVLAFGSSLLDPVPFPAGLPGGPLVPKRQARTLATESSIAPSIDADLQGLLERTVIANIPAGEKMGWRFSSLAEGRYKPLVHLGTEKIPYALMWNRSGGLKTACSLVLPQETTDHRAWLAWFLRELTNVDPDTFPHDIDWRSARTWATARTLELHSNLAELRQERTVILAKMDQGILEAETSLEHALAEDALESHRLLTADGIELENAVEAALKELGFTVANMDDHHDATTKAKLEDLRVTDDLDPGWLSLVEIKGYAKGAKANDVTQIIGRPMRSFLLEAGREPSSVWHIVNPQRNIDPSSRNDAIPNDLDLQALTDADGALIETRQLFLALRDVQSGQVKAPEVRDSMKAARTRWNYRKVDTKATVRCSTAKN